MNEGVITNPLLAMQTNQTPNTKNLISTTGLGVKKQSSPNNISYSISTNSNYQTSGQPSTAKKQLFSQRAIGPDSQNSNQVTNKLAPQKTSSGITPKTTINTAEPSNVFKRTRNSAQPTITGLK